MKIPYKSINTQICLTNKMKRNNIYSVHSYYFISIKAFISTFTFIVNFIEEF